MICHWSHSPSGANVIANGSAGQKDTSFRTACVGTVTLEAEATRECWAARTRAVASDFGSLKDPPLVKMGPTETTGFPMAVSPV